jgi:uncharacterized membrane protein
MSEAFRSDFLRNKSAAVVTAISSRQEQSKTQDVANYSIETTREYQSSRPDITRYDQATYSNYVALPTYSTTIPYARYFGQSIFHVYSCISIFLKISMLLGFTYLLLHRTGKTIATIEYRVLCSISLVLILAFTLSRFLSLAYNFERLVQQSLILLALPMILGLSFIWRVLSIRPREPIFVLSLSTILIYFLFTSGLVWQFAGGPAYLQLNKFGAFYDRYYFHNSEHSSLQWLSDHHDKASFVYADEYAMIKFLPYSSITPHSTREGYIMTDIIPSAIDKNAYVYASYSNTTDKLAVVFDKSAREISYNFPSEFLNQNKNRVYSNGYSEIFK